MGRKRMSVWKVKTEEMCGKTGEAGHIPCYPRDMGNRRRSKEGVRQRLTIDCKEQRAQQRPGYPWGIK